MNTLPPNQILAARNKWPVVGERTPRQDESPWQVSVLGHVERPERWTVEELQHAFPWHERVVDIHCVTRWSKPGARFGGVRLHDLLDHCAPTSQARFISFVARSERSHSTSLSLEDVFTLDPLVALTYEQQPLTTIHGGPIRTIVPHRYFYKSLKWLESIELLAEDRLGYWEGEAGYHNHADPWQEERYIASGIKPRVLQKLLQSRDLTDQHLLSLQAAHMELPKLRASRALLRNADFRNSNLQGADFQQANLSNAHFQGANLQGACFQHADVEGANFCNADLRGADFSGASLFGATFCSEDPTNPAADALLDTHTRIDPSALEALSDQQQAFLRRANSC